MTRDLVGYARAMTFVVAVLITTSAKAVTSTLVQGQTDWGSVNTWADGPPANPGPTGAAPTTAGGSVPDAAGDEVFLQQRVDLNPARTTGSYTISLGAATRTIGELTSHNTNNTYNTVITGGTLIFDNIGSDAVWTENLGTGETNSSRTRITATIQLDSNLIMDLKHNLRRNSPTSTTTPVLADGDENLIKRGDANIQFEYGDTGDGFFGELLIENGAIRLTNGTGGVPSPLPRNTVFEKAKGITVSDLAQLQFGNGVNEFNIGESSPGVKGEVKLTGLGNDNPHVDFTFNEGALRFEQEAGNRNVSDFNSPIRLLPASALAPQVRIYVTASDATAKLNEEVRGDDLAGLNKGGNGLLKLMTTSVNGNTYAGNTNVSSGALAVNNTVSTASGVGTGDVFINNGGKVGGTGVIGKVADASNVTVSEGTLSPGDLNIDSTSGNLVESAGTLTVFGDLTFAAVSFLNMDIGSTSDQLVASGAIDLGGSSLNLALGAFVPDGVQSFTLLSNTGAGAISDIFGTININGVVAASPDLDLNGETYHLSYTAGTGGNDLLLLPGSASAGTPGDYNDDGFVDAADYVTWRKGGPLANDTAPAGAGPEDYAKWFEQFGAGAPGSGGSNASGGAVPEPATAMLAIFAVFGFMAIAKRR